MTYPFKISSKDDLFKLCKLARKESFPIFLRAGSEIFDAKSLLGLFAVVGKEATLVVPDYVDKEKFAQFIADLNK